MEQFFLNGYTILFVLFNFADLIIDSKGNSKHWRIFNEKFNPNFIVHVFAQFFKLKKLRQKLLEFLQNSQSFNILKWAEILLVVFFYFTKVTNKKFWTMLLYWVYTLLQVNKRSPIEMRSAIFRTVKFNWVNIWKFKQTSRKSPICPKLKTEPFRLFQKIPNFQFHV